MGDNFVQMSVAERVTVLGRASEVVPQALLNFTRQISLPSGGRQARLLGGWIPRSQTRTLDFIWSFILLNFFFNI